MLRTMKARLLVLLSAIVVLFGLALIQLGASPKKQALLLVEQRRREAEEAFESLVGLRTRFLHQLAYDYSYWDDLVLFTRTLDTLWVSTSLRPVLKNYGADLLWICGPTGAPLYAASRDGRLGGPWLDVLPPPEALDSLFAHDRFARFFIATPRGVAEVRGATIHPTADEARKTKPRGSLFFGLLWDDAFLRDLATLSGTALSLVPAGSAAPPHEPEGMSTIRFTKPLPGYDGRPIATLHIRTDVPGVETFLRVSRQYVVASLVFAVGLLGIAVVAVTRWVSMPLRLISRSLATDDPTHVERLQRDRTEFGDIASLITRFFQQRHLLQRENAERRRAEEAVRVSHRFLEIANRHRELEPLLREFALEIERFTGCTLAGIHLSYKEDGSRRELTVGFGDGADSPRLPCARSEVRGICRAIIAGEVRPGTPCCTPSGTCVMNRASQDLPLVLGELHWDICTRCWRLGYESIALVPIRGHDRTIGLIEVADQRKDMFEPHIVEALEAVAKQLGIAVLRVKAEERLAFMATHDLLTGLPNRAMVGFRLRPALASADERQERVAVMMLDLDYFKTINDTLGHAAGDRLLQAASQRISAILRRSDTAVRMGGDEFMIILPEVRAAEDASKVASKILEVLRQPFFIDDRELRVTGSIGIALYPEGGTTIDALLKHADIAMYHAKSQGRNTFCIFTPRDATPG